MNMYGPTLLTKEVATKGDLKDLVICTEKLPDPSTVIPGTVMVLTKSQPRYTATHVYKIVANEADENVWVDVSDKYSTKVDYDADLSLLINIDRPSGGQYLEILSVTNSDRTAEIADLRDAGAGDLVDVVIVRKTGDQEPVCPTDGDEVVRFPHDKLPDQAPYQLYDVSGLYADYKYSAFEVFESGWYCKCAISVT